MKIKRRRRVLLFSIVIISIATAGFFLLKQHFAYQLKQLIARTLAKQVEGSVSIDGLTISMAQPTIEINGLEVSSDKYGISEFIVDRAKIKFSPFPIFFGKVIISKVELGDTRMHLRYPSLALGLKQQRSLQNVIPRDIQLLQFVVERASLQKGTLIIEEQDRDWLVQLNLGYVETELAKGGHVKVNLEADGSIQTKRQFGLSEMLPIRLLQARLLYHRERLAIEALDLQAQGLRLETTGTIYPQLNLGVEGETDLAIVSANRQTTGEIQYKGQISGSTTYPKIKFNVKGTNIRHNAFYLDNFNIDCALSPDKIRLANLTMQQEQGSIRAKGSWDLVSGDVQTKTTLNKFDLSTMQPLIQRFMKPTLGLQGHLSGNILMTGKSVGRSRQSSFTVDPRLSTKSLTIQHNGIAATLTDFLLDGEITMDDRLKRWAVKDVIVKSNELQLSTKGFFDKNSRQITLSGAIHDLWHQLLPHSQAIRGSVGVEANLSHDGSSQTGEIRIEGQGLEVAGDKTWDLTVLLDLNDSEILASKLRFGNDRAQLLATGRFDYKTKRFAKLATVLKDIPISFLTAFLPPPLDSNIATVPKKTGSISANVDLDGFYKKPTGSAKLQIRDMLFFNEPFDLVDFDTSVDQGTFALRDLTLIKGEGSLIVKGTIDSSTKELDLNVTSHGLRTNTIHHIKKWVPEDHQLRVQASLSGPWSNPDITAESTLLTIDAKPILVSTVKKDKEKWVIRTDLKTNRSSFIVNLGDETTLLFNLEDFNPFGFFRELGRLRNIGLDARLQGSVKLSKPTEQKWGGRVTLDSFDITHDGAILTENSSLGLVVQDSLVFIGHCLLSGDAVNLNCTDENEINGSIDLETAARLFRFIPRAEGSIHVRAQILGPLNRFNFAGTALLEKGIITLKHFPTLFEDLQINAELQQDKIVVKDFSATAGNGNVKGGGEIHFQKWQRTLFDLFAKAESIPTYFPEDFPAVVSGSAKFSGPDNAAVFESDLAIERLRYKKRFDWRSRFLFVDKKRPAISTALISENKKKTRGVTFRLRGEAKEPVISIQNNAADARLTGSFTILGKYPVVGLQGVFDVDSGTIDFNNQEFDIESGTINFRGPKNRTPLVDVYASAQIDQYTVTINLHTVNDQLQVDMSATPPLEETDILALLTVGSISDSFGDTTAQTTGLTEGVAVGIVSGTLQEKVERIGIIDTFQVVPDYSQTDETSELRIMLGKDLTKNLRIIYSTDLYNVGADQEVRLNQNIKRNFSILGVVKDREANDNVDFGVDLEFSLDF